MKRFLFLFALAFAVVNCAFAKGKQFEGILTFNVESVSSTESSSISSRLIPDQVKIFVKGSKSRIELETLMSLVIISDGTTESSTTLLNIFGMKYAMELPKEEIEKGKQKSSTIKVRKSSERKKIAGYLCKKASLISGNKVTDIYYTESFDVRRVYSSGYEFLEDVDGMPLEFYQNSNGNILHFVCTDVEQIPLSKSLFEIPSDYEMKSSDEFKDLLGL